MSQGDIDYYDSNQGWLSVLNESPKKLIARYEGDGLIEVLNVRDHLEILASTLLSVSTLKSALDSAGCKKTGKKKELVGRLIDANREAVVNLLPQGKRWGVTRKGGALVDSYLAKKKVEIEGLENDILELIVDKQYLKASKRRASHNARQVFPPGMGCSWDDWDTVRDVRILSSIGCSTPEIFASRPTAELDALRTRASLFYLMGEKLSSRLCGLIPCEDASMNDVRLFSAFGVGRANLEEWKESGAFKYVRVLDAGDDSCPACRALSGKRYLLGQAPELPSILCTHEIGCRCCYVPA